MNFFDGHLQRQGDAFLLDAGGVTTALDGSRYDGALDVGRKVTVGVRPHDVRIVGEGHGVPLSVSIVEALGTESFAHGEVAGTPFVARVEADMAVKKGDRIHLAFSAIHLFDTVTGASLRAS
jgi:sn-glycerol 3-phosphate transport system ATP-binding protein/multiple sugar transport system ATP-binding protein